MERYEVFPCEGGFRVCGDGGPGWYDIKISPWFKTKKAAEKKAAQMRKNDEQWVATMRPNMPKSKKPQ
jgi:hypothetical protein